MADTKENPNTKAPELSKEEMEKRRAEITAYYEEHIPALEVQLKYEGLLRDIEKCRAERIQAQMFVANTMQGPPEMPPAPATTGQSKEQAAKEFKKANFTPENAKEKANALADSIKKESKRTLKKTS